MKKHLVVILALVILILPSAALAGGSTCATIQDGVLKYAPGHYLAGQPLTTGFDPFGYNYQAHLFSGSYANAYLGKDGLPPYTGNDGEYLAANPGAAAKWYWPYRNIKLEMKWNDAWLSNRDCNGDGRLDRPDDNGGSYTGSGAWLTNHTTGGKGKGSLVSFTKITAVPADAKNVFGVWYTTGGTEIGPVIWGSFAIVQEVESRSGALYVSPAGPGMGRW